MTYNEVVAMVEPWALNGTGVTAEEYAIGMDKYERNTKSDLTMLEILMKEVLLNHILVTCGR